MILLLFLALSFIPSNEVHAEGYNHRWIALTNAGGQAMKRKDFRKAELFFEKALLESKKYGNRSKEMASSINNLAGVSMEQELWKDAESYLVLALSMREDILDPKDPGIANTCFNLGICAFKQEKLGEAARYFSRAIDIRYSLDQNDPRISQEMAWLARVYKKQGRIDQAKSALEDAIAMRKRVLKKKDPTLASMEQQLSSLNSGSEGQ